MQTINRNPRKTTSLAMGWEFRMMPFWLRVKAQTKIIPETGCFEFTGNRNEHGYGRIRRYNALVFVHREAYADGHNVVLTSKDYILHKCDNPACYRLDHLEKGDQLQNMRQCVERGRHRTHLKKGQTAWNKGISMNQGENHGLARFTDKQVLAIKLELREENTYKKVREIATRLKTRPATIQKIRNGTRYGHIKV